MDPITRSDRSWRKRKAACRYPLGWGAGNDRGSRRNNCDLFRRMGLRGFGYQRQVKDLIFGCLDLTALAG